MSPKQQRKFHGIRRPQRRGKDGWRWFRDGQLEVELRKPERVRPSPGGHPLT
jgi:hypothetical protein